MPDTLSFLDCRTPSLDALLRKGRRAALPGFIARKVIASGAEDDRGRLLAACRAELAWCRADVLRIAGEIGLPIDPLAESRADAVPIWELTRLPHEHAAARLLNAWDHLHPAETRLALCHERLEAQRDAGWTAQAADTEADIRLHERTRRRAADAMIGAAEMYRASRREGHASAAPA